MKVRIELEDVGGSFKRFLRDAPTLTRAEVAKAVKSTTALVKSRMKANASRQFSDPPDSPAPHLVDFIEGTTHGLVGTVGIDDPEQAAIALYNEYSPNRQPFMRPALEETDRDFKAHVTRALQRAERRLSRF